MPDPDQPRTSLELAALRRGDKPAERSALAVRRLLAVVAEWPEAAGIDVTLGVRPGSRRVRMHVDPLGPVAASWQADVRDALRAVGRLRAVTPRRDLPPLAVAELRAGRELSPPPPAADEVPGDLASVTAVRREERMATPWPSGRLDDLAALLRLLQSDDSLSVRFRLASATPVEATMVGDAVRATWPGEETEVSGYVGRPVRLRALLGSATDEIPARLRATARQWATDLRIVEHRGEQAARLWAGPAESLAGCAVPEVMALGLLRLPAAGATPVAGMRSEWPTVAGRPLDPVPARPRRPIRIGRARGVGGPRRPVLLDVADLRRSGLIVGAPGAGKSMLLRQFIRSIAERDDVSFTFLDPHGSTARLVAEETPSPARDRTRYFRFGHPDVTYGVNLLLRDLGDPADLDRRADAFADLIADKDDPRGEHVVGPRWRRTVGLVIAGVVELFGERASLVVVAAILSDIERIRALARQVARRNRALAHRIDREVGRVEGKEATDLTSWVASKFHPIVSSELVRGMFGSAPSFDLRAEIAARRNLVLDLNLPALGGPATAMLAANLIEEHRLALGHTDPEHTHVLVGDELHRYQFGGLPSLLAEGRKFGLPVIGATQHLGQLRTEVADAFESNVGFFASLRTGQKAALRSSGSLDDWPVAELTRLRDLTAAVVMSRDGVPTDPFTLDIDHLRRMAKRGPDAAERADAARSLDERTRELHAVAPDRGPLSEDEILERLGLGRRPGRPAPSEEMQAWWASRRVAAGPDEADDAADAVAAPGSAPVATVGR